MIARGALWNGDPLLHFSNNGYGSPSNLNGRMLTQAHRSAQRHTTRRREPCPGAESVHSKSGPRCSKGAFKETSIETSFHPPARGGEGAFWFIYKMHLFKPVPQNVVHGPPMQEKNGQTCYNADLKIYIYSIYWLNWLR